jgi:hypothetical protein
LKLDADCDDDDSDADDEPPAPDELEFWPLDDDDDELDACSVKMKPATPLSPLQSIFASPALLCGDHSSAYADAANKTINMANFMFQISYREIILIERIRE